MLPIQSLDLFSLLGKRKKSVCTLHLYPRRANPPPLQYTAQSEQGLYAPYIISLRCLRPCFALDLSPQVFFFLSPAPLGASLPPSQDSKRRPATSPGEGEKREDRKMLSPSSSPPPPPPPPGGMLGSREGLLPPKKEKDKKGVKRGLLRPRGKKNTFSSLHPLLRSFVDKIRFSHSTYVVPTLERRGKRVFLPQVFQMGVSAFLPLLHALAICEVNPANSTRE